MAQSFQDLLVWQKAIQMSVAVYKATQVLSQTGDGLASQLQRAAVSVASTSPKAEAASPTVSSSTSSAWRKDQITKFKRKSPSPATRSIWTRSTQSGRKAQHRSRKDYHSRNKKLEAES